MKKFGFCPVNISNLQYDTACLQISNELNHRLNLFSVSSECFKCNSIFLKSVSADKNFSLVVPAVHSLTLTLAHPVNNETYCNITHAFQEHELAKWTVEDGGCSFESHLNEHNVYQPLYVLVALTFGLILFITLMKNVCSHNCTRRLKSFILRNPTLLDLENDLGNPNSSTDSEPLVQSELVPLRRLSRPRVLALDTFRGLTISLMIFVNYGGGKYWFFEHAAWNGLTFADLVFPWFAWVMGVSLVLSYRSKLRSCSSRCQVLNVSLRRGLTLLMLGLLVNAYKNNNILTLRYCGVLQRLGLAYLIVSTVEVAFMKKHPSVQRRLPELWDSWRQWLVILSLVVIHTMLTFYLEVPGCPTGYIGPGGLANNSAYPNCTGGAAHYIDHRVFNGSHLYQNSRVSKVYSSPVPFDPEGLLGTLTTCLTVYLGVQAGYIILSYNSTLQRSLRWMFWALITGVAGGLLCDWAQEGGLIPINKQLWSLSFALITSSLAFLIFNFLFVFIDHLGFWWHEDPFRLAGMNAILLYIGHIVTKQTFPWSWTPVDTTSHSELLFMNVVGVLIWLVIARRLHQNQIYLSI